MYNPFAFDQNEDTKDNELIRQALGGDKEALEQLVLRHQAWI